MKTFNKLFKIGVENDHASIMPVITLGSHNPDGKPTVGSALTISTRQFSNSTFSVDHPIVPMLKDFPTFSSSIDVIKSEYKISNLTFNCVNAKYAGKTLAQHFALISNTDIVGQEIGLWLVSEHNEYFGDCPKVYSGVVTKIKNSGQKIIIQCEDLSSKVLNKKIPYKRLSIEDYGKFSLNPYPMNYGYFVYSPLYKTVSDTDTATHGVFDNEVAYYGDNSVKGVHFFEGANESRLLRTHSGLFRRYNEQSDDWEGAPIVGGDQWSEVPNKNEIKFNKIAQNGSVNLFADNQCEAEFHFNKSIPEQPSSNMLFETINITTPEQGVDAAASKKFPIRKWESTNKDVQWVTSSSVWGGYQNGFPGYLDEGELLSGGIKYNNREIVGEDELTAWNENYTSANEYIRLVDFSNETYVGGEIGFNKDVLLNMGLPVNETFNTDTWQYTGATVGVDCVFESPPHASSNQRCFFTIEADMIARIENSIYSDERPINFDKYTTPTSTDGQYDNFGRVRVQYEYMDADYPGQLSDPTDTSSMNMGSEPALLFWIDDKVAGGWFASLHASNRVTVNPDYSDWEGVKIKMGSEFASPEENLRTLTFSKLPAAEWNSNNPEQGFDWQDMFAAVMAIPDSEGSYVNDIYYTGFAESTNFLGMFIDFTGSTDSWGNQYQHRGSFTVLSWANAGIFKNYLPPEVRDGYDTFNNGSYDLIHNELTATYGIQDTMMLYSEPGNPPKSLSFNLWDSSQAVTLLDVGGTLDDYDVPDLAETGEMWIKALGYYMIYAAEDFNDIDLYAYLKHGRKINQTGINSFLFSDFSYDSSLVISNPAAVVSDIMTSELGHEFKYTWETAKYGNLWELAFDEHASSPIWLPQEDGSILLYNERHKLGFSQTESAPAKEILENISSQSRIIPFFDGLDFTFITIKSQYNSYDQPEDLIEGCTYPFADNYDSSATLDDGSCLVNNIPESSWTYGCKDPNAITEEMAEILFNDGLIPSVSGYYDSSATIDNNLCYYETSFDDGLFVYGCTDEIAENYNANANIDDLSCDYGLPQDIRVRFTMITHSQAPVLFEPFEIGIGELSAWRTSYSGMDAQDMTGLSHIGGSTSDNYVRRSGESWIMMEGGMPFQSYEDYPPNTLVVHQFPSNVDRISSGNYWARYTHGYDTLLGGGGTSNNPQPDPNYEAYYQTLGTYMGSYDMTLIGAGYDFYEDTEPYSSNYQLLNSETQTGYGILLDSVVLEHERQQGFDGGAWKLVTRWYTVEGRLPRPNQIVYVEDDGTQWEWQDYIGTTDATYRMDGSIHDLRNAWIYERLDALGAPGIENLFNFSHVKEAIEDGSGNLSNFAESGNIPLSISAIGMDFNSQTDASNIDIKPGYWTSEKFTGVSTHDETYRRTTMIAPQNRTIYHQQTGSNLNGNWKKNRFPNVFMQVDSYDPNYEGRGYAWPNHSMVYYRNPNDGSDFNASVSDWENFNSYAHGGKQTHWNSSNNRCFANTPSQDNPDDCLGTKFYDYVDTFLKNRVNGEYEPIGVHWWLENSNVPQPSPNRYSRDRGATDISKTIYKYDVINYKVTQTRTEDIIGRCRVKYNQTSYSGDFEYATDWFYWYDIPAIKQYYEDLGTSPTDTTLQEFYNIDSTLAYDEDAVETNFLNAEKTIEANYINDVHSARALAQYVLGWNMNIHQKLEITLPIKYIGLEIGDIVNIDKLLGDDVTVNSQDYSYENFLKNITPVEGGDDIINYETRLGQSILPIFIIDKVKLNKNMTVTLGMTQMHDWSGKTAYNSEIDLLVGDAPPPISGDAGDSVSEPIYGCTDSTASNYNPDANTDDGSCEYAQPGDVNGDGMINVLDVVQMVNQVLGNAEVTPEADVNEDGNVDVLDVVTVINIILNS
tara:strand:+ start:199 stop:5823 length:5625 start_codon:yes stop_codon:yes gene_type:complete